MTGLDSSVILLFAILGAIAAPRALFILRTSLRTHRHARRKNTTVVSPAPLMSTNTELDSLDTREATTATTLTAPLTAAPKSSPVAAVNGASEFSQKEKIAWPS
jgi:hypothetical protein